jgi:DNA-binding transcriptional ArsR family regulator
MGVVDLRLLAKLRKDLDRLEERSAKTWARQPFSFEGDDVAAVVRTAGAAASTYFYLVSEMEDGPSVVAVDDNRRKVELAKGEVLVDRARLAVELGLSRDSAKRHITELERAGLIRCERRIGGRAPNVYRVLGPRSVEAAAAV